jgi:hypothetical protein
VASSTTLRFHRTGWLLSMIACAVFAASASDQVVSFPGQQREAGSPNRRYTIKNSDRENEQPVHVLTLIDDLNGSAINIYGYARHVDVLWSPSSEVLNINDYQGSNSAKAFLYVLPWTGRQTDLLKELVAFLQTRGKGKEILGNDHVYFTARSWLNSQEVLCRLKAYGAVNPKGIERYYVYRIGKGFRRR